MKKGEVKTIANYPINQEIRLVQCFRRHLVSLTFKGGTAVTPFKSQDVTNINFLKTVSIHNQEKSP